MEPVPTIRAPDIVLESVAISLQLIFRSSSSLLDSGVQEMIALYSKRYRSFCCNTACEIKRCKRNLGSPRKLQSRILSSTTGNPPHQPKLFSLSVIDGQRPPHLRVVTAHSALFLLHSKLYSLLLQHFPIIAKQSTSTTGRAFTNQRQVGNFVSEKLSIGVSVAPK